MGSAVPSRNQTGLSGPFTFQQCPAGREAAGWVCGFLLTLRGPLSPTPARKQIKLQFHHLEGAVSCPKAAPHIHSRTQSSGPPPGRRAPVPPTPQHASLFPLLHCREEWRDLREERGRGGMGGCRRGLGPGLLLQFNPRIYFAAEDREGLAPRLCETPAETLRDPPDNKSLYAAILAGHYHHHLFKVGIRAAEGHQQM